MCVIGKSLPLVACVRPDVSEARQVGLAFAALEDKLCACVVLDFSGMNNNAQQQTLCVNENVSLASKEMLARIIARRVRSLSPPFLADLTVCESMAAAEA